MAKRRRKRKSKKVIQNSVIEVKRRSPIAHTAILRKGGAHQKSRSSDRQKQKHSLRKAVTDYGESRQGWSSNKKRGEQSGFFKTIFSHLFFLQYVHILS